MTVGWNFRPVEPRFPHKIETWEQKPTEPGNVLTILNFRGGNMGTGEPSLSFSQPLSFSSSRWLWVEVSDLLCFHTCSTLLLLAFWFSLVKARGVHGLGWGFFTQPTVVGQKKFNQTQSITYIQLNPHGLGWTHGLDNFFLLLFLLNWAEKNISYLPPELIKKIYFNI